MPQVSLARVKGITITFSACSLTTCLLLSPTSPRCKGTLFIFILFNPAPFPRNFLFVPDIGEEMVRGKNFYFCFYLPRWEEKMGKPMSSNRK